MNYKITKLKPFGVLLEPQGNTFAVGNISIFELKKLFSDEQLIVLRGFNTFNSAEQFADYCELLGEISIWPFGKVLELIKQKNPEDHIFDSSYVPLHWDGMYRPQVPEYQVFHCVKAPAPEDGGKTTFTNTILTLANADISSINLWKKVTGTYKRSMEFYNSETISPIIAKHPYKDYSVIRYNEPVSAANSDFINPPDQVFTGISLDELEHFHKDLQSNLYDANNFYAHQWQTGDIVIADNFSLLHGREKFASQSDRHIQRVQVLSTPAYDNPNLVTYK